MSLWRPAMLALVLVFTVPARGSDRLVELSAGPADAPVEISADQLVYFQPRDVFVLTGQVRVVRGDALLRSSKAEFDRLHGTLVLSGGVLATRGRKVAFAEGAIVDLNARTAELMDAVLLLKERDNPALAELTDPALLRRAGKNALTLGATQLQQLEGGAYRAVQVRITPCDCAGRPDYSLLADTAVLEGDRAALRGVTLDLFGLPIPLFPLSMPLLARQSGLLQPTFGLALASGFTLVQPVFFTLGRSWDLTVTPGFFTGRGDATGPALNSRSIKGPRLAWELRWAPAEGSTGEISSDLVQDLAASDTPPLSGLMQDAGTHGGRGFGGLRGIVRFAHRTEGAAGTFALQGTLLSDTMVLQDAPLSQLDRYAESPHTEVGLWRARGPLSLGISATLLQDLRLGSGSNPDRRLFGPERPHTPIRAPSVFAHLAEVSLGPVALSFEASATEFVTVGGPSVMERATGFSPTDQYGPSPSFSAFAPDPARASGLGRGPRLRFDLAPRASLSLQALLPAWLGGSAFVGARGDAWLPQGQSGAEGDTLTRLQLVSGGALSMLLARRFGELVHTVSPALELRAVSSARAHATFPGDARLGTDGYSLQGVPNGAALLPGLATAYSAGVVGRDRASDEIDSSASPGGAVQLSASLMQAVWRQQGKSAPIRVAWLSLRQDALAWDVAAQAARLAEADLSLGLTLGPASLSSSLRFLWTPLEVTDWRASATLRDARGDNLHAGLLAVRGPAGPRLRAGIDELFSSVRLASAEGELAGSVGAGVLWIVPVANEIFRVSFDSTHSLGPLPLEAANWGHKIALWADTPCRCAGFSISAEFPFRDLDLLGAPTIRFVLDLKALGAVSTL